MAKHRDDKDLTEDELRAQHERTLQKYKHLDIDVRLEMMEALEKGFHKASKKGVKQSKSSLSKDFLEKHRRDQRPDDKLFTDIRSFGGVGGTHNDNFEPGIPTGIAEKAGEMPWDQDEDD
jgi:hypothetical protein